MSIFREFCCRSGGSNLNAGSRQNDGTQPGTTADLTYAAGSWVQSTRVFTVASGNPAIDGVVAGDRVSVYPDGTTPDGVYFSRVSSRDTTSITLTAAGSGVGDVLGSPPTNGTGNRTLKVGGAWKGPNGASTFPFNLANFSDAFTSWFRINLKNDQTYSMTAAIVAALNKYNAQGYTSSYGDLGRVTIDGGSAGASYILLSPAGGASGVWTDISFQNNGATGNQSLVQGSNGSNFLAFKRCAFAHSRGTGLRDGAYAIECEAYDCNQSNTASCGGFFNPLITLNCISHDNTGSNTYGIFASHVVNCIADSNGGVGFYGFCFNCDAYNNGSHGFNLGGNVYFENCNSIKNGGWGYLIASGATGMAVESRYGAGTMANGSGGISIPATAGVETIGSISAYPDNKHPWVSPDTGDFRIILRSALGTGRGNFSPWPSSTFAATIAFPDIGAVQNVANTFISPGANGGMNG